MKNFLIILLLTALFAGCSTEANIEIINRTNNNLYIGIDGENYTLAGDVNDDPSYEITVDTGNSSIFSDDTKKVELYLEGDTFLMQTSDSYGIAQGDYFTVTELELKQNESRKVYCDATHAGLKVYNNFDQMISNVKYTANNLDTLYTAFSDLSVNDFDFYQLTYYSLGDTIYYSFQVEFDDGTVNNYGGPGNLLEKDELFFIDVDTLPNE